VDASFYSYPYTLLKLEEEITLRGIQTGNYSRQKLVWDFTSGEERCCRGHLKMNMLSIAF
jgi:hypothetical protein